MSTHCFAIERVDIVSNQSFADVVGVLAGNVPRFVIGALATLVAAASTGCGHASSEAWERKTVIAEQVSTRSQHPGRLYAAVVKPRIESTQSFRVAGRIAARLVDVGDAVSKAQVLATLDASDWALNAQALHGQLTAAIAQRDSAQADLARYELLTSEKLLSPAELDRQQHAVAAAVAQVAALTAGARQADNKLSYAQLRADADGVVTQISAEPGQVVSEGIPVLTLAHTAEREVEFSLPEQQRGSIHLGQTMQVSLWSAPDAWINARVRWISPAADPTTRAFLVRASLLGWPPEVLFGMTASVRIPADGVSETQATLPLGAVFDQGGATAVWIVDAKSSVLRSARVEIAGLEGNRYLIRAGVHAGEWVVTGGVHRVRAGDRVQVFDGGERPTRLAETR